MSAQLDMNSNRLVNLPDAVSNQEPVTLAQAAVIAGLSVPLTQNTVGDVLWPQTAEESAAGKTPVNTFYPPGEGKRWGVTLDGTTDDTSFWQDAVDSGHPAYTIYAGTTNIEGTITLDGEKELVGNTLCTWERQSGSATTPMIHMYGNRNFVDIGSGTIRQDLYANPHGIILIGPAIAETEGGLTDVQCYNNTIQNFKLVGPENGSNPQDDGAPGIYIHSLGRKKYTLVNPTYDTRINNAFILNCDTAIEFSTDVNRSVLNNIKVTAWKTAVIYMNSSYGNQIYGLAFESPLNWTGGSPRYAIHLKSLNASVNETGTDVTYGITEAYNNFFYCYCELTAAKGRLMDWDPITNLGGYNKFRGPMAISDGYGKDGSTTYAGLGTNSVEANSFDANPGRHVKLPGGFEADRFDDDTGGFVAQEGHCRVFRRIASMAEGTHYNYLEWDNFGGSGSSIDDSAMIEITYAAKAAESSKSHVGKMLYSVAIENNVMQTPVLMQHLMDTRGENPIVNPVIAVTTGTATNTGKITIAVENIPEPLVSSVNYCALDIKLVPSPLLGTNLDWSADLSMPSTTYTTAAATVLTTKFRDHDGNAQIDNRQSAITSITDSTGGAATNTVDDTTLSVRDDVASLAAKINEIIVILETHGLIAT